MGARMKRRFLITAALFALFAVFTVLVTTVDVRAIGPEGSKVGLAGVNGYFKDAIGYRESWHTITDFLGYIALASVGVFALIGFVQLLQRGLLRVDYRILLLGGFYIAVLAAYVLFEVSIKNSRPVILDEGLEASYPSSHTMLGICTMGAAMMQIQYMLKKKPLIRAVGMGACTAIMVVMVVGRTLSGVHWFTDILGSIILSAALLMLYYSLVKYVGMKIRKSRSGKKPAARRS